ncbi:MAG: hypothetical protein ABIN91_01695 [Mucilaginibacter sp.]|uniref:hypothetical protein n=1 Tax=Mucilaginibacter sp. TaxID=1882438 RepID=UPI003264F25F
MYLFFTNFRLLTVVVLAGIISGACKPKYSVPAAAEIPLPINQYPKGYKVDSTDLYSNIQFDIKKMHNVFVGNFKAADLSAAELKTIDSLIRASVKQHNQEFKSKGWGQIEDLKNYRRQLVAAIDAKGAKHVYINAFTTWPWFEKNWKKHLAYVNDGGSGFFYLYINLKTRKVYSFGTNGLA